MITSQAGGAVYERVAAELREEIASGRLAPGQRVPTEAELMQTHGIARETARRALALLRAEGLLDVRHGHPTRVRVPAERTPVALQRGSRIIVRMPTPQERVDLAIGEGVPVPPSSTEPGSAFTQVIGTPSRPLKIDDLVMALAGIEE